MCVVSGPRLERGGRRTTASRSIEVAKATSPIGDVKRKPREYRRFSYPEACTVLAQPAPLTITPAYCSWPRIVADTPGHRSCSAQSLVHLGNLPWRRNQVTASNGLQLRDKSGVMPANRAFS